MFGWFSGGLALCVALAKLLVVLFCWFSRVSIEPRRFMDHADGLNFFGNWPMSPLDPK